MVGVRKLFYRESELEGACSLTTGNCSTERKIKCSLKDERTADNSLLPHISQI
jgi:hypothetical protein